MYLEFAPVYRDKGLVTTPLFGKRPFLDKWEETNLGTIYLDKTYRTKNDKTIYLTKANIGLLCGSPSGVICIDIDTPDLEIQQIILDNLPETPVMKKGKKGVNFFYRHNGESTVNYKNPILKKDNLFELISTGRQTVLPPSIHPDSKKAYEWCDRDGNSRSISLLNVELDSLPYLPKNWINTVDELIKQHFNDKPVNNDVSLGVAALFGHHDVGKKSHKQMNDYNPETIPEGYEDRCRSGAHTALTEYIMALVNAGKGEGAVKDVIKYDEEYNTGYASTYYNCRTCKFPKGEAEARALLHIGDLKKTVIKKKMEEGDTLPVFDDSSGSGSKEFKVVKTLLEDFDIIKDGETIHDIDSNNSSMLIQSDDLFQYMEQEGYWRKLSNEEVNKIKRRIQSENNGNASFNKMEATFKMFKTYLPTPDIEKINMHQGNPYRLCLKNGTLHVVEDGSGYSVKFFPHSRKDFCTNRLELEYDEDFKEKNEEFEEMLERIFEGDEDKDEKILAIQELFGASLLPCFPKVYFLHGKAGAGKSTLFLLLSNLLASENIGRVDPSDFRGFLLEPLLGKMINMVTDIRTNTVINSDVLKQIEDRVPYTIQRKGRVNVTAPLPAIHCFGGNDLPKNFDTGSTAFERRIVFVSFNNVVIKKTGGKFSHDRNFAHKVFNQNPQGVLNFALKGIKRICENNGQFTQPKSGHETMDEWTSEYDVYKQFMKEIGEGDVEGIGGTTIIADPEGFVDRRVLWDIFKHWMIHSNRGKQNVTRQAFYKQMRRDRGERKSNGFHYVKGVKLIENNGENFTPPPSNEVLDPASVSF